MIMAASMQLVIGVGVHPRGGSSDTTNATVSASERSGRCNTIHIYDNIF